MWDTGKAVLREKYTPVSAYIRNTERHKTNYLILHLKLLEKQEQENPKQAEGEK
jgi:hypothetical protein